MSDLLRRVFNEQGQSPWLDNLQRSYVTSGTLKQLVDNGVRGLTSNPTIFQKAIQGSSDYDDQFVEVIGQGKTPLEAYWELVTQDIHGASAVFMDLYESSHGLDGYVSVEVDPRLAHDSEGTLSAARELHGVVNRDNVMIKIPATLEGIPAIQTMIAEGRNVNVTLIFSLDRYQMVLDAYINGLRDRASRGLAVNNIASVASFFISRVDNEIDKQLDANGSPEALQLRGTSAINQARLAYEIFQKAFSGADWDSLAALGAHVQRPLWASTSTKNPAYKDTLYVDELIGPSTVNTLPEATLNAFADHGVVSRTIDTHVRLAHQQWDSLANYGVDVRNISQRLEQEGVASFIASFEDLTNALIVKSEALQL
jgi:transaldolase